MSTAPPPPGSDSLASAIGALTRLSEKQLWRPEAPKAVRNAWKRDDHAAAWRAWSEHLEMRKTDAAASTLVAGKRPPSIVWGLPAGAAEAVNEWLDEGPLAKGQAVVTAAHRWVADSGHRDADLVFALECVAWATALPGLASKLGADAWWSLTETLARIAQDASTSAAPDPTESEAVVVEQLLAGELPLTLSRLLPDLRPFRDLASAAKRSLSEGIERLTDGEGMLTATLWTDDSAPAASLLLASWTRCRLLAHGGKAPWDGDAQSQYEWLVRQTLRLSDRLGRPAFAAGEPVGVLELLREALRLDGDPSDLAAAASRLKGFHADESYESPESSNHSEWSEIGVLSAGWRDKSPRIVVAHPADTMRVEVRAGKHTLFCGDWPVDASIDGESVRSTDDWECQCWHSDKDGDYLELALELAGGARLERQFFLSRQDGVGFLAETLFSGRTEPCRLALTAQLPLGEEVSLRPEKETREAVLTSGGEIAGIVPLSLAEWRDDPRGGAMTCESGMLKLTRERVGLNAASFLWIDFSAQRFAKQRTWRQLTVAEMLKNVTPDVAIAYRVQAAKEQWFLYRSLTKPGNRTVLGQNLSCEMLVGKFKAPKGEVDEYFEIEGPEE